MELKLIAGTANPELAAQVSEALGVELTPVGTKSFADGEVFVQIDENIRGCDVYVIQPTCQPVNDALMELLLTIATLRRSGAGQITAVVPYYGYARQDRKDRPQTTISAADVASMIEVRCHSTAPSPPPSPPAQRRPGPPGVECSHACRRNNRS